MILSNFLEGKYLYSFIDNRYYLVVCEPRVNHYHGFFFWKKEKIYWSSWARKDVYTDHTDILLAKPKTYTEALLALKYKRIFEDVQLVYESLHPQSAVERDYI